MVLPEDTQRLSGTSFILQWVQGFFSGDEYSREATKRVLLEVSVVPCFALTGCGGIGGASLPRPSARFDAACSWECSTFSFQSVSSPST